jgi:hypothetical protein
LAASLLASRGWRDVSDLLGVSTLLPVESVVVVVHMF